MVERVGKHASMLLVLMVAASVAPGSVAFGVGSGGDGSLPPPAPEPGRMAGVPSTTGPHAVAHVFVAGDVVLGEPEPGEISVVASGRLDDSGYLPIVVRNGRDEVVYDVEVTLTATDASGAEVGVAEYFIPTGGLAPGEWAFGGNAAAVPTLGQAQSVQLQFSGSSRPGAFVWLDVIAAELRDGAIAGTVTNNSAVAVGDFNPVSVACFDGGTVTAFEVAMARSVTERLDPGESANFSTEQPIDPTACPAFAVYAVGLVNQ